MTWHQWAGTQSEGCPFGNGRCLLLANLETASLPQSSLNWSKRRGCCSSAAAAAVAADGCDGESGDGGDGDGDGGDDGDGGAALTPAGGGHAAADPGPGRSQKTRCRLS